jgi:hypothetical protein
VFALAAGEAEREQAAVQLGVLGARRLLEAVECLVQLQHLPFVPGGDETGRLLHVHLIHQFAVEERGFYIHVVH